MSLNADPLYKNSDHATLSWCLSLSITFTDHAKSKDLSWGLSWFLPLYQSGTDTGLTYTINLLKEPVHIKLPAHIGPNPVLVPQPKPPKEPDPLSFTKTAHTSASEISLAPKAYPLPFTHTKNLILTLVNQTFLMLNAISPDLLDDCWLCFHSQPPF